MTKNVSKVVWLVVENLLVFMGLYSNVDHTNYCSAELNGCASPCICFEMLSQNTFNASSSTSYEVSLKRPQAYLIAIAYHTVGVIESFL